MKGWIIYYKEDAEKNKQFIKMIARELEKRNISLELIIFQGIRNIKKKLMTDTPDFVINRSRNTQVAKELENAGIRVFNSSKVTEIANNKGKTYNFLKGIVPFLPVKYEKTVIISQIEDRGFTIPYVIKSCSGHGGEQVYMILDKKKEKEVIKELNQEDYIVQECCSDLGKDVRVYIIGNEIVEAVLRTAQNGFKSNYSLGGNVEKYCLNQTEKNMVKAIIQKISLDYVGIDFTFHKGKAVFNEIEDVVGARMLYEVSNIDIAKLFVEYIAKECKVI